MATPAEQSHSSEKHVCVVGSCNFDLIAYVPRLPKLGETLEGRQFRMGCGGKGANQAVQCARLGARVHFVGKVGKDLFGQRFEEAFKECGVVSHLLVDPEHVTGVAPISVDAQGNNSIVIVPGANAALTPGEVASVGREWISHADVLLCQLELSAAATREALAIGRDGGALCVLNPAPAPAQPGAIAELVKLCDVLCPNETELEILSGRPIRSEADLHAATTALLDAYPALLCVLVTLGEKGCLLSVRSEERSAAGGCRSVSFAATRVDGSKVVDTTGAGDSFLGALAYFLAREMHQQAGACAPAGAGAGPRRARITPQRLFECLSRAIPGAAYVAARSVQFPGTQTSYGTRDQLPAWLFDDSLSHEDRAKKCAVF